MWPGIRRALLRRFLRGDLRRRALFMVTIWLWHRARKLGGKQPELVYRARLGRDARVSMRTSKPLPRSLPRRSARRALQVDAARELAEIAADR